MLAAEVFPFFSVALQVKRHLLPLIQAAQTRTLDGAYVNENCRTMRSSDKSRDTSTWLGSPALLGSGSRKRCLLCEWNSVKEATSV
jgi:hypothetical protein